MKLATMMMFKSVICVVTGVIFLIFPTQWLWLLRADLIDPSGTYMARLFGATFLLLGMFLWMIRGTTDATTRRALVLSIFVGDGIALIVSLLAQLAGITNPFGWGIVLAYFLLTLGFGYFQFVKPSAV